MSMRAARTAKTRSVSARSSSVLRSRMLPARARTSASLTGRAGGGIWRTCRHAEVVRRRVRLGKVLGELLDRQRVGRRQRSVAECDGRELSPGTRDRWMRIAACQERRERGAACGQPEGEGEEEHKPQTHLLRAGRSPVASRRSAARPSRGRPGPRRSRGSRRPCRRQRAHRPRSRRRQSPAARLA